MGDGMMKKAFREYWELFTALVAIVIFIIAVIALAAWRFIAEATR